MSAISRPERLAALGALTVLCTGFAVLLAFWLIGDWPTGKGLFDYRSATLGDAILLPLIAAVLIATIAGTPATRHDLLFGSIGLAVGTLAGAATQVAWHADDSPNLNWTLPAPHDFNAPGWYHAVFLSLVSGALLALALLAATRVRAARLGGEDQARRLAASPWLGVLFGGCLAFAGLLVADNQDAAGTDAGLATIAGLAFAATLAGGALAWAFGPLLRQGAGHLATGLAAALGATAVATWGLPAPPGIAIAASVAAAMVGVALSDVRPDRLPRVGRAFAVSAVLLGSAAAGFEVAGEDGLAAAVIVAAGSAIAVAIGGLRQRRLSDEMVVGAAVFYVFGVLVLAAWLSGRPEDQTEAAIAVGASLTFLDALVITLVRNRYAAFMDTAQAARHLGADPSPQEPYGDATGTWALIAGLALPTLISIGVLFAVAAPSLGTNDVAGGDPPNLGAWLAADVALLLLTGLAVAIGVRGRAPVEEKYAAGLVSRVPRLAMAGCLIVAAAAIGFALSQLHGPLHQPLAAAIAAIAVGVLVTEDLVRSTLRLQLAHVGADAWAVAIGGGAMVAAGVFWLLVNGLWDADQPTTAAGALKSCGLTLLALSLCAGGFGVVISMGLRTTHLTEQPPWFNAFMQQLMYAALIFVVVAIPFFVVGRIDAQDDLSNAGLVTLAGLGFMPALLGAIFWVLGNNKRHALLESGHPLPDRVLSSLSDPPPSAEEINEERKRQLLRHVDFVNRLVWAIMAAGLLWIAVHAL